MNWYRKLSDIGAWPIFGVFFIESFVLGNWIPRIPDIKASFGLSATELGFNLLALSFGTLFAFVTVGSLIRKVGLRRVNMLALPFWALFVGLAPWMPNGLVLAIVLVVAGVFIGMQEVAMNTAAENVARDTGVQIMSRAHGFWSLGSLFGALCGSGFAYFDVSVAAHFAVIMPLTAVWGLLTAAKVQDAPKGLEENEHEGQSSVFSLPSAAMLGLFLMPIGVMLVEGAFIDWSAVFVQSVLNGGAVATGLIYSAFSLVMAATRLSGDAIIARFGPKRVAQVSALSATFGIGLFAMSPGPSAAFGAAILAGLGVAIVYPLIVTAAARRPGNDEDNVAAVSLAAFGAFMIAPPIIGFLADTIGLRYALLMIAPIAFTSFLLSGELEKTD